MAHAAAVSLHQILDQIILQSDHDDHHFPKPQIKSLRSKVRSLQIFLENIFPVPKSSKSEVRELETQVRDAVYAVQDTIESYISSQISADEGEAYLKQQLQSIDLMTVEADKIMASTKQNKGDLETSYALPAGDSVSSLKPDFSSKNKIVGLEDDINKLKAQLKGDSNSPLKILPIVGMAGIGKTTLAAALYDDSLIKDTFLTRSWVTVSQEYRVRDILLGLLGSLNKNDQKESDEQLKQTLYQTLVGKRYLVVVDDMWDTTIWDNMRHCFPNQDLGSRIILTTRLSDVAHRVNPSKLPHEMQFLNEENSWKLLCQNAFADARCPSYLEEIGKEIATNCGGLGLVIVVVGGLLSKSSKTLDYWKIVAEDINLAIKEESTDDKKSCMGILSLSYNHLPSRSKGCFLYLGAFPEDHEIPVSKLLKLWIAEEFLIPPEAPKSLEEAAEAFLVDLIERNLVTVRKLRSNGQIRTCKIHDLVRDMCMKESTKEKFCHVINKYVQNFPEGTDNQRRISVHKNILMCISEIRELAQSIKPARSLLFVGQHHHHPLPFDITFELLRVLDALTVYFINFPDEIENLFHLRYLSLTYNGKLPSTIVNLENLLILIIRQHPKIVLLGSSILPVEIWYMSKLRHLQFTESDLPNFPEAETHGQSNSVYLENLQYLSNVNAYCCTEEVLRNVPNLKRLGIWIDKPSISNDDLPFFIDKLQHLENLKFVVLNPNPDPETRIVFDPKLSFPKTLKKLSLSGCCIPWEEITVIGQLELLEVLKLRELAFQGEEWEPEEGEFRKLQFLLLEYMDLVEWFADEKCFPKLESLIFRHCYKLEEIPMEIKEIESLKLLELVDCKPSAADSAKAIEDKLKEDGDERFQVVVHSSWK